MTLKYTKMATKVPNGRRMDQMAIKYAIFHWKTLQKNFPNWNFWFWKYTIWQPWLSTVLVSQRYFLRRFEKNLFWTRFFPTGISETVPRLFATSSSTASTQLET
jgi:hypothetical protein